MVELPKILRTHMIEELNKELKDTCLKYIKEERPRESITNYRLMVVDKYVNQKYQSTPDVTKEFEELVRNFFKEKYGIENTGYSNSIVTINAWK